MNVSDVTHKISFTQEYQALIVYSKSKYEALANSQMKIDH